MLSCLKLALSIRSYHQAGNSQDPPRMPSPVKKRGFAEGARSFCRVLGAEAMEGWTQHCPCHRAQCQERSCQHSEQKAPFLISESLNNTSSQHSEVLLSTNTPLMQTNHKMNVLFTLHTLILRFLSACPSHQQRAIEQCHTEHLNHIL